MNTVVSENKIDVSGGDEKIEKTCRAGGYPEAVHLSLTYYKKGLYCSEALLRAFNEAYGLGLPESACGIATGFGAGLGNSGCACGAVTAGVAVLGLVAGRTRVNQSERIVFQAVADLHDRFREQHKALCCRVLTRSVKWGSADHKRLCETKVRDAAMIVDELLKTSLCRYLPGEERRSIPKKNLFISLSGYISRKLKKKPYHRKA